MWKKVESYSLHWHNRERRAAIHVRLEDGTDGVVDHLSCSDLGTLASLLRDEPMVWYHTVRGDITTHSAPQYEEDLD